MTIERQDLGVFDGKQVRLFTLRNAKGREVDITNYGGSVVAWRTPDKQGDEGDIVLGYENLEGYLAGDVHLGALVGRVANRIQGSEFELNGKTYHLAKNVGDNHLHGGNKGYGRVVWDATINDHNGAESLVLRYFSPDGEENYPGNLHVRVTYTFTDDDELRIDYYAVSDKDTIINLTNHAYFNLAGHDAGSILDHVMTINADHFTPVTNECIPFGEIRSVDGTPFDFRTAKVIGDDIDSSDEQIVFGEGFDHNWVLNRSGDGLQKAAEVYHPGTGRVLEVFTTKPGMQFYSGNHLDGTDIGKGGVVYGRRSALCLETQYFPNAINLKNFPSPILRAEDEYRHCTVYKCSVR